MEVAPPYEVAAPVTLLNTDYTVAYMPTYMFRGNMSVWLRLSARTEWKGMDNIPLIHLLTAMTTRASVYSAKNSSLFSTSPVISLSKMTTVLGAPVQCQKSKSSNCIQGIFGRGRYGIITNGIISSSLLSHSPSLLLLLWHHWQTKMVP